MGRAECRSEGAGYGGEEGNAENRKVPGRLQSDFPLEKKKVGTERTLCLRRVFLKLPHEPCRPTRAGADTPVSLTNSCGPHTQ